MDGWTDGWMDGWMGVHAKGKQAAESARMQNAPRFLHLQGPELPVLDQARAKDAEAPEILGKALARVKVREKLGPPPPPLSLS